MDYQNSFVEILEVVQGVEAVERSRVVDIGLVVGIAGDFVG